MLQKKVIQPEYDKKVQKMHQKAETLRTVKAEHERAAGGAARWGRRCRAVPRVPQALGKPERGGAGEWCLPGGVDHSSGAARGGKVDRSAGAAREIITQQVLPGSRRCGLASSQVPGPSPCLGPRQTQLAQKTTVVNDSKLKGQESKEQILVLEDQLKNDKKTMYVTSVGTPYRGTPSSCAQHVATKGRDSPTGLSLGSHILDANFHQTDVCLFGEPAEFEYLRKVLFEYMMGRETKRTSLSHHHCCFVMEIKMSRNWQSFPYAWHIQTLLYGLWIYVSLERRFLNSHKLKN
ncbi:uncharacterized protein LOC128851157 [Cuculus canorus]|uniref:uncharacterized protein LOC128851157 n=1 Tax=Cuculus canorus TaxID=55661 RepID=UPI0023AAFC5E|nr:uncharacterized protein LOC128851157 [Cuculus canorus]